MSHMIGFNGHHYICISNPVTSMGYIEYTVVYILFVFI